MAWVSFLLVLVSGYCTFKFAILTNKEGRLKYLGFTIASGLFLLMQLSILGAQISTSSNGAIVFNQIAEWSHVICLAFILSSLAVFIRESKPAFAQFPMLYTALPLLIIVSYFLVKDTYALKEWLLAIYQGGAIIVSLLMYSVYTYRNRKYTMILSGICLFLISYMLYWYVPGISNTSYSYSWELLIGIGMITTLLGYEHVELENSEE